MKKSHELVAHPQLIVKMKFGSCLYGTETEDSDQDYKGVFLPSKEQILLGRIPKSFNSTTKVGSKTKNVSSDVDYEVYSLHYFLDLACQGQTVALDMLHAPQAMILESSSIWDRIVRERYQFYTKGLEAFVGYARRQAAKYGIKGSRLNAAGKVVAFLKGMRAKGRQEEVRLSEIWEQLPKGEHIHFIGREEGNTVYSRSLRQYQVVGKRFQETARVGYVLPILKQFYEAYGERAEKAARNEGIDWKAVSHALRAAYQTREILMHQTITFPLKEAPLLKLVKQGELDYQTKVVPELEMVMDQVEALSKASTLPAKADRRYWEKFIMNTLESEVFARCIILRD